MAVTAKPGDTAGLALDARITALTTQATFAPAGSQQAIKAAADIVQAQMDAVQHYLGNGRILPATVISTLSISAAKIGTSNAQLRPADDGNLGAMGSNLANRITSLTTTAAIAGFQQSNNQQLLLQAQMELVQVALAQALVLPATVLSSLS